MTDAGRALLENLRRRGWTVREATSNAELLPDALRARYPALPIELVTFLASLETCHNRSETVWFLTRSDFLVTDEGFRWDEYERMALDSARVLRNPEAEIARVRGFWDAHFPFIKAVHSDYDYLGVRLTGEQRGAIVHGFAPEWEEADVIAPSFDAFLASFAREANTEEPSWPYDVFLADPGTTEEGSARLSGNTQPPKPWWKFW